MNGLSFIIGCAILSLAYIFCTIVKLITINVISNHPEWSDDKIKNITEMISKDSFKINIH